ncbi:MAG TPA: hypothetical protein VJB60_02885 [Candidatus Peribacterales bacterium]|nr:hypothetical protein [Candidatus Peribacterales bacterium]
MNIREPRMLFYGVESPVPSHPEEGPSKENSNKKLKEDIDYLALNIDGLSKNLRFRAKTAATYIDSKFQGYRFRDGRGFFVIRDIPSLKAAINLAEQRGEGSAWEGWAVYLQNYIADEGRLRELQTSLREKQSELSRFQGERTRESLSKLRAQVESNLPREQGPIPVLKSFRRDAANIITALLNTAGNGGEEEKLAKEYFRLQDVYESFYRNAYIRAKDQFDNGNTKLLIPIRWRKLGVDANHPAVLAMQKIRDEYTGITAMEGFIDLSHRDILKKRNDLEFVEAILKKYKKKR